MANRSDNYSEKSMIDQCTCNMQKAHDQILHPGTSGKRSTVVTYALERLIAGASAGATQCEWGHPGKKEFVMLAIGSCKFQR